MIEGVLKEGFITTSYDSVVNWGKDRFNLAHDLRPGVLRGRDDARDRSAV
jgi:hypothetical protein